MEEVLPATITHARATGSRAGRIQPRGEGVEVLTPRVEGDGLLIDGRAEVGDKYPNICCQGHEWEVLVVFPDADAAYDNAYGICGNPDCDVEADSHYHGVSNCLAEDLASKLLEATTTT